MRTLPTRTKSPRLSLPPLLGVPSIGTRRAGSLLGPPRQPGRSPVALRKRVGLLRSERSESSDGRPNQDPLSVTAHLRREEIESMLRRHGIILPEADLGRVQAIINERGRLSEEVIELGDHEIHYRTSGLPEYNGLRRAILVHVLDACVAAGATVESVVEMAARTYYQFTGDSALGLNPEGQLRIFIASRGIQIPASGPLHFRDQLRGPELDFTIRSKPGTTFRVRDLTYGFLTQLFQRLDQDLMALCDFFGKEPLEEMRQRLIRAGVSFEIPAKISRFRIGDTMSGSSSKRLGVEAGMSASDAHLLDDRLHRIMADLFAIAVARHRRGLLPDRTWLDALKNRLDSQIRRQIFLMDNQNKLSGEDRARLRTQTWFHLQGCIASLIQGNFLDLSTPPEIRLQQALVDRLTLLPHLLVVFRSKDFKAGVQKSWANPVATVETLESVFLHLRRSGCAPLVFTSPEERARLLDPLLPETERNRAAQLFLDVLRREGIRFEPDRPTIIRDLVVQTLETARLPGSLGESVVGLAAEAMAAGLALQHLLTLLDAGLLRFHTLGSLNRSFRSELEIVTRRLHQFGTQFSGGAERREGVSEQDAIFEIASRYAEAVNGLGNLIERYRREAQRSGRPTETVKSGISLYHRLFNVHHARSSAVVLGPSPRTLPPTGVWYASLLVANLPDEDWRLVPEREHAWLVVDGPGDTHVRHMEMALVDFHVRRRRLLESAIEDVPTRERILANYLPKLTMMRLKIIPHPVTQKPVILLLQSDAGGPSDLQHELGGLVKTPGGTLLEIATTLFTNSLGIAPDHVLALPSDQEPDRNEDLLKQIQDRLRGA